LKQLEESEKACREFNPSLACRTGRIDSIISTSACNQRTQISLPWPSYSTLLGIISACAGRIVKSEETRIGFEFKCKSRYQELERKDRLALKDGVLKPFRDEKAPKDFRPHIKSTLEGSIVCLEEIHQGIGFRQVYWHPTLDLYITDTNLKSAFEKPQPLLALGALRI